LTPDWWDNVRAIRDVAAPVLVVHSADDKVNPAADGRRVFAAAREPKRLAILQGFSHNALYLKPQDGWWTTVLALVRPPRS
jgi:hypothetical protein